MSDKERDALRKIVAMHSPGGIGPTGQVSCAEADNDPLCYAMPHPCATVKVALKALGGKL